MYNVEEIARKRAILFSARTRFSSEIQPVRATAIDKIVEQNLLITDNASGVTLEEMVKQGAFCGTDVFPKISRQDMENSFLRLIQAGRVFKLEQGNKKYRLSEQALSELWEIQKFTENRFSHIIERLFKNSKEGHNEYSAPFLDCLCLIFSRLGETYVRLIKGEIKAEELLSQPSLNSALKEVKKRHSHIDGNLFESALYTFFRDSDPDYDAIKWNMAQNYYVAKVLGMDVSGRLLSSEIFGNAAFYLDTNVIIPALESKSRHHQSFRSLSKACNQLGAKFKFCQITLDELRFVVKDQHALIAKVIEQIPNGTAKKIKGIFFQLYRERLETTGEVDLDSLFAIFDNPAKNLTEKYKAELVDDSWFVQEENSVKTKKLMETLNRVSQERRGRPKRGGTALHDSLLLRWVLREQKQTTDNTWLVTLDTSLPGISILEDDIPKQCNAITLDALLQWISPMAKYDDADEIAAIFSEAVKYQLLPQESFFDLRDFIIFAEMEFSCKELPAEDVEECIRYLKAKAPTLNPLDPSDREKLSREISKFFADPSRKYKREMQEFEAKLSEMKKSYENDLNEKNKKTDELKKENESLKTLRKEEQKKLEDSTLKKSAIIRVIIWVLIFLLIESISIYCAKKYGSGSNFFQKVKDLWFLPTLSLGACLIFFYFFLGKTRIKKLGWPFTKFIK